MSPAPAPPKRSPRRPAPPPAPPAAPSRSPSAAPRYRRVEITARPEPPTQHAAAAGVPFVSWPQFLQRVSFSRGDHITLIGRTKSGKTTLTVGGLLPLFDPVCVAGTKPYDENLYPPLERKGYTLTSDPRVDWRRRDGRKVIFRPRIEEITPDNERAEAERFRLLLNIVYAEGRWALYLDEVRYLTEELRLGRVLNRLWLQGRSLGLTMIAATQEPVSIPRVAFSQVEHLFIFKLTDDERIKRAAELAGAMTDAVRAIIPVLSRHEALYVAPSTDLLLRTRYPRALSS